MSRRTVKPAWRFVKEQCLHCREPACASACFAKAFQKTPEGPVVYYPSLCVGCRYCMVACPFSVPKYEWEKPLPYVTKCMMCASRVTGGRPRPAFPGLPDPCDDILATATRFWNRPRRSSPTIPAMFSTSWGEGSRRNRVDHISDVPFEELGFKTGLTEKPLPSYTLDLHDLHPGLRRRMGCPAGRHRPVHPPQGQDRREGKIRKRIPLPARTSSLMKGDRHECASRK